MKHWMFTGVLAVAAVVSAWAQGTTQFTVVPYGFEAQNGDTRDGELFVGPTMRQQLWTGSYLAQAWTQPVLISELAFRLDERNPSTATTIPRVEVRLATSQRTPENLTLFWEINAGADQRTVFFGENYSLVATGGAGPNPFDVRFRLNEPFYYDPSSGNLLMYIETWSPSGQPFPGGREVDLHGLESAGFIGSGFSTPFHFSFVTEFSWQSVPEPTSARLLAIAGLLFALIKRRRN